MNNVTDLNNPPNYAILDTKVNPIGLPSELRSNGCLVIQHNLGKGNYAAQLAFSFGSDKIAIRRKKILTVGLNGNILQLNKIVIHFCSLHQPKNWMELT